MLENIECCELTPEHARFVAELHCSGIKTGFITSIGLRFVEALYEAIAQSDVGFGLVAKRDDKVVGFISFATSIKRLYKTVILKKGLLFAFLLAGKLLSFKRIKKILETLCYPKRIETSDLPAAELLAIVVEQQERGKGLGSHLLKRGLNQCSQMGLEKVKVLVGADNTSANALYLKCGFVLAGRIENHGVLSNLYVCSTEQK